MTRALVLLAIVGLMSVSPAQGNIIYSNSGPSINGDITPSLGSVPSFTTVVHFTYQSGDSGVVVDEVGDATATPSWHDSQVEVSTSGQVYTSVWGYNTILGLGAATPGDNTVVYSYNATLGKLFGSLDGAAFSTASFARQDPNTGTQYWSFGVADGTKLSDAGNAYTSNISSVVISNIGLVPEPSSFVLLGLSGIGLLLAGRRVRARRS